MYPEASSVAHHEAEPVTAQSLNTEVLGRLIGAGAQLRPWLLVTGALLAVGLVGLVLRIAGGFEPAKWSYVASVYAYLMTVAQSAPIVAVALRLVKADWRRPATRVAELFTAVGLLNVILVIPLLIAMPSTEGRLNIWMDWTVLGGGVPFITVGNLLAQLLLTFTGLALLWASAIPDMSAALPQASGARRIWYARLAGDWLGSTNQWIIQRAALGVLGALYFIFYVSTQTLLTIDFSMSMIPGWWSAIYPAQLSLVGLQSGLSATLIALYVHRRVGGLGRHLRVDQFWGLAKLLLALSLFWFYFWWSEFITVWYGRAPREQNLLLLVMFGPYFIPFVLAFLASFVVPWLSLIWNPVRKSILGPTLVAVSVLIGCYFNTIRLFVAPWALDEHNVLHLEHVPATPHFPDAIDLLIVPGFLAGAIFCYLLATRLVPTLNLWEMKEGLLLRVPRPFMRSHETTVIAKPQ